MVRPPSDKLAKRALLLRVAACVALATGLSRPPALDLAVGRGGGHAVVQLGFASFSFAFDSGQQCPNLDSCSARAL